jgi:glycerol-3-phosphate O-acyltransferase
VTACRTKLLAVVPRLRQRVTLEPKVLALVDDLIREALADLGRSQGEAEADAEGDDSNG